MKNEYTQHKRNRKIIKSSDNIFEQAPIYKIIFIQLETTCG